MFCTHCGAKIEDGYGFCTQCGQPLWEKDAAADPSADETVAIGQIRTAAPTSAPRQNADSWLDDDDQFDAPPYGGQPYASQPYASRPGDDTAYLPQTPYANGGGVTYRAPNPAATVRPVEVSPNKKKGGSSRASTAIVVILLLIALGILIGLLVAILSGGLDVNDIGDAASDLISGINDVSLDEEEIAATAVTAADDEEDADDSEDEKDEDAVETTVEEVASATLTEAEIYAELADAYDALSSYSSQISSVASDFNNYYSASSYDTRSSYAQVAFTLLEAIGEAYSSVSALAVTADSSYHETWEDICYLYYCLEQRVAVICEAWEVSLSYDDTSGHQDEILAPIVAARGDDGANIYLTAYNELYADAEPAAPSE